MSQETKTYFSDLVGELGQRAARSIVSKFSPVSDPLRAYLHDRFERFPGEAGSFLADPVFEAGFGWEPSPQSMQELAGTMLQSRLIASMDAPPPELIEQRFAAEWHPYLHQVTAWRQLQEQPPRSVIVSSGTGSGKTECFLIPILNDLARQLEKGRTLVGVQALMLYPLNALINSQRDRLRAWSVAFGGGIRFALYNGDTPQSLPAAEERQHPEEVRSRKQLRSSPPPILVTNATMLEYMLVRQEDHPIIDASQGMLRWIILDEAHTYVGSHAAEMSLLLRRVLHAFGVASSEVRFVATSATIGGKDERAADKLRNYLADIAGIDPSRVDVITGRRFVPPLPEKLVLKSQPLPTATELESKPADVLYEELASAPAARRIRTALEKEGPQTLSELSKVFTDTDSSSPEDKKQTLEFLDISRLAEKEGESFLPLRAHLFHRTQGGLWACGNRNCPGKSGTALESSEWGFGKLFLQRQQICDEPGCSSRVFEVVFCDSCGAEYLSAELLIAEDRSLLRQRTLESDDDVTEGDTLIDEENLEDSEAGADTGVDDFISGVFPRLIAVASMVEVPVPVDPTSGEVDVSKDPQQLMGLLHPEGGFRCARCGQREKRAGELFRPARSSAAFHLLMSIPTLLEHTPPAGPDSIDLPFEGRRLITFSDSRQGTARFSLQAQLDAERNYVRSWIYHRISAAKAKASPEQVDALKQKIAQLEEVYASTGADVVRGILEQQKRELKQISGESIGRLSWGQVLESLKDTREISQWLREHWNHTQLGQLSSYEVARLCVTREFARRPKRQTSLETLGFISLHYPALEQIGETHLPAAWRQHQLGLEAWRDFLKIAIDFTVRGNCAVLVPSEHTRWIGIELPKRFLVGPDTGAITKQQVRWPLARSPRPRARLPLLLFRALGLNTEDSEDRAVVNELLNEAWRQLLRHGLLTSEQDGHRIDLERQTEFRTLREGWLCPVTRRVVDVTLGGWTPYLTPELPELHAKCQKITMPEPPYVFGRDVDERQVSRREVVKWLEHDPLVNGLRKSGIWSAYSDRISLFSHYCRVSEHSAQQNSSRLRKLEEGFKSARINILSCSTTMEMGVDIGGISCVAMNNAPPSPANYLQRAGRAGRRKETAAVSFTLCQSIPHGEAVFANPAWPFRTPITLPQVSLQSRRIIQRHINALTLTRFLFQHAANLTSLKAGWFFLTSSEEAPSPASDMETWASKQQENQDDIWLSNGIKRLIQRTALEGVDTGRLIGQVALELMNVRKKWREEHQALVDELERAGGIPLRREKATPAQLAVFKQLQRMEEEYLLGELAASGFLPGYGFPTGVVPFVTSTIEDLRRNEATKGDREDDRGKRRGFPSRDLPMAIREYAPGTDVVIDAQVYTSEGVTLNWHVPAGDYVTAPELQSFRNAWWCQSCGSSGTRSSFPEECSVCHAGQNRLEIRPYLQPAGFAVNIFEKPHNDLSYRRYVPVNKPWITSGQTLWSPLPRPELGRYRFSHEGHIFHQSGGISGFGYAICLRCGKAASENNNGGAVPRELDEHFRLRGGKEENGQSRCQGNDQPWAIKRNQWLGVGIYTDVFELQLSDPETGSPLVDDVAAYSLAAALRQSLAEELGITDREISCASIPSRTEAGQIARSIVLYDTATGGAGFVASAASVLPALLRRAKEILDCRKGCDAACHACLLNYDTQHEAKRLDRHKAQAVLSESLLSGLRLPSELCYFGNDSRLEFDELQMALFRELQRADIDELRVYLGGAPDAWDVLGWPLRQTLLKLAGEGRRIVLFVSEGCLHSLEAAVANPLASLAEAGSILVRVYADLEKLDVATLIAEVGGPQRSVRWACTSVDSLGPSENWGRANPKDRCVRVVIKQPLSPPIGKVVESASIRRVPPGTFREVVIRDQLNGPIEGLGTRFWQMVMTSVPHLKERIDKKSALVAVEYRDRYLSSPMNILLLTKIVEGLVARCGKQQLIIETVDAVKSSYRLPDLLHHDWQQRDQRNRIFKLLMAKASVSIEIRELPQNKSQHARDLTLRWADGARWTIRLDHGLGFLRSRRALGFDFEATAETQAERLSSLSFIVENGMSEQGTFAYLTDVVRG